MIQIRNNIYYSLSVLIIYLNYGPNRSKQYLWENRAGPSGIGSGGNVTTGSKGILTSANRAVPPVTKSRQIYIVNKSRDDGYKVYTNTYLCWWSAFCNIKFLSHNLYTYMNIGGSIKMFPRECERYIQFYNGWVWFRDLFR